MKALCAFTILLLSNAITPAAFAQGSDAQTGAVGETQTRARSVAVPSSFEALPLVLKVGQEVRVRVDTGRAIRGKVVSITDARLVIARRQNPFPYFRPRKEQAFAKDIVQRVDVVDSALNGALLGAAAGVGLTAVVASGASDSVDAAGSWMLFGPLFGVAGAAAGGLIDVLMSKTIYEREPRTPTVALAPMLGRGRRGVMAQVHF